MQSQGSSPKPERSAPTAPTVSAACAGRSAFGAIPSASARHSSSWRVRRRPYRGSGLIAPSRRRRASPPPLPEPRRTTGTGTAPAPSRRRCGDDGGRGPGGGGRGGGPDPLPGAAPPGSPRPAGPQSGRRLATCQTDFGSSASKRAKMPLRTGTAVRRVGGGGSGKYSAYHPAHPSLLQPRSVPGAAWGLGPDRARGPNRTSSDNRPRFLRSVATILEATSGEGRGPLRGGGAWRLCQVTGVRPGSSSHSPAPVPGTCLAIAEGRRVRLSRHEGPHPTILGLLQREVDDETTGNFRGNSRVPAFPGGRGGEAGAKVQASRPPRPPRTPGRDETTGCSGMALKWLTAVHAQLAGNPSAAGTRRRLQKAYRPSSLEGSER